ncbi:tetratricopeptide repeat protein [Streptomyces sp. NPDC050548]|uniref:tetratricopeptide repeat protein n=1 Tax=Streptomyces sp. NPDC050548 TaxID=3365629 RepID=UPI00378866FB
MRPWLALIGPLLAVVVLTAGPAGVKAGELSWPKWLVAGLVAAGGVLVAVWTPIVKARTDALAARTTRAVERETQAEGALSRLPTLKGKVPVVEDVIDRGLIGIHEAIPLPTDTAVDQGLSVELPTYVPRDIDADLRTALEARSKTGGFVLLVGPAAAGKTRCAYEAIRAVVPRWRLFMPGDAATVTELVSSGADLKQSVLWLNETQNFLTGPDRLKASTIRRLLADVARPVILIGTIWPTTYDQLRASVASADSAENAAEEGEDHNTDAFEVLSLARRFSLGVWSDPEWERAQELTALDPRIAQAARHRGHTGLTQTLAAAPELIHRWEQGDSRFGQLVITAAVVARRCGHPATIPDAVIKGLATEWLTGAQRANADEGWLADALNWACRPVHHSGGIAPLQAAGEVIGQVDGYQVSDILVDYEGPSSPVSESKITTRIWRLVAELSTPRACLLIGRAAYRAQMLPEAAHALERAALDGNSEAMFSLGGIQRDQGDMEAARTWWENAAESGNARAMTNLGYLLNEQGDLEGARTWSARAANAGNIIAMSNLGNALRDQGDIDGARTWYTRAADAGNANAMFNLGNLLHENDDPEGARTWWERAADAGTINAMVNLGNLLHENDDPEGARTWWERAADGGNINAMVNLGNLLHENDDPEGARTWWERAADAGNINAMFNLGSFLHDQDDTEGARTWYTRAADAGDTDAMVNLGSLLDDQDDPAGARIWYRRAADAGDTDAMVNLGSVLDDQDDPAGARTWWERAADGGNINAMVNLGNLLHENDDPEGARTWWERAADVGSANAMFNLGSLLHRQDDTEGARTWYTRGADAGDTDAMVNLGSLLDDQHDPAGARTWWERAADAGDTDAMVNLGSLLRRQDDTEGARTWYARAADAGDTDAAVALNALRVEE